MKRIPRCLLILVVIIVVSFLLASLADLYLKNPPLQTALNFFGLVVAVVTALLTVVYARKPTDSAPHQIPSRDNRQALLQKVQDYWVKGLLEKSLYKEVLIELGMETKQAAVDNNPWDTIVQQTGKPNRKLGDKKILEVFSEFQGALLILGDPGSGKTTTLLELTRDLIALAIEDDSKPIPVVFNLSSWALERKPLAEWLVDELHLRYQVPPKIGKAWVDKDYALTLLLDGLDEVAEAYQDACVEAINTFRSEHEVKQVVCSRIADYDKLKTKLRLEGAVVIQALTDPQIEDYLKGFKRETAAIRELVKSDVDFRELMKTPLFLSIALLAYQGMTAAAVRATETVEDRRKQLFEAYVKQVFERHGNTYNDAYPPQQTIKWLCWLAGCMVQLRQTDFYLENLQSDWLPEPKQRLFFRLMVGLMVGLVFELVGVLVFGLLGVLWGGLVYGLVFGLLVGLLGGLGFGLLVGLGSIRSVDRLIWKPNRVILLFGLVGGLLVGLLVGLLGMLLVGPVVGLLVGLLGGLVGALVSILQRNVQITPRTQPNQGIRNSLFNGLLGGLLVGMVGGLVGALLFGVVVGLLGGLVGGLGFGLLGMLLGALLFGGDTALQHSVLRMLLSWNGYAPWDYVDFLDVCAKRILLQKVGGGYIFIHRTLMEYFAALESEPSASESR